MPTTTRRSRGSGRDMAALVGDKNPGLKWLHLEGGDHGLQNMDDVFMEELIGFLGAKQPIAS